MADTETPAPNDSEFVELTLTPAPTDDVANPADDTPADDDAAKPEGEAPADDAGAKDEAAKEGDDEEKLRDEKGRYKGSAQARIDEAIRRQREAERRAATAERALSARPAADAPAKPSADDFEDYGEYVEALTDWKADQRDAKRAGTEVDDAHKHATEARHDAWSAKIEQTAAALPDYAEVVGKSDLPIANHVGEALMDAERGPELAYHLAKNPDVAERLNEMSPTRAAIELGRIEASLEKAAPKPPPPPKTPSNAPAPITPVKPGSTTAKDPAKMDMAEYKAWRAEQLK